MTAFAQLWEFCAILAETRPFSTFQEPEGLRNYGRACATEGHRDSYETILLNDRDFLHFVTFAPFCSRISASILQ
jgi:hypothetical protein